MKVLLLCLVVVCASPVLPFSTIKVENTEDISTTLTNKVTSVVNKENEEIKQMMVGQLTETTTEEISIPAFNRKQGWNKRRPSKRPNNRFNQLNQRGKLINGRKRRPLNEKKGFNKKTNGPIPAIRYLARSPHTDQLNKALDEMLTFLSQTLTSDNSSLSMRLNDFQENMEFNPWEFIELKKSEAVESVSDERKRSTRALSDFEEETAEADPNYTSDTNNKSNMDDDEEDDLNPEEDQKLASSISWQSSELESITENLTNVYDSSVTTKSEHDKDGIDGATEINGTQPLNGKRIYLTQQPSLVPLGDGTVEYNLRLLSAKDLQQRKLKFPKEHSHRLQEDDRRTTRRMQNKRKRGPGRRFSRRPYAQMEGIGLIRRSGDVMIGKQGNSTTHLIDTELQIGPLQFIMDKRAGFPLQLSRVSSPPLIARLRLTESEGKLVAAQLKPKKIRPNDPLVTLRLREDGRMPTHVETARLVSYLSQEMTKSWNSGYLLRRIKRQFKKLYMDEKGDERSDFNFEEAWKLVQSLAAAHFGQQSIASPPPINSNVKTLSVS